MYTVEQLLSVLALSGMEDDRLTTLELLWEQHSGNLAGTTMLQHADTLASIYWKNADYAKAEPLLASLWSARVGDFQSADSMQTTERDTRLSLWFITGYRYANSLTKLGVSPHIQGLVRNEKFAEAKSALAKLWNARAELPSAVFSDVNVFKIADSYAYVLLSSGDSSLAEEVAGTVWRNAKETERDWDIKESILFVGERYAKALNVNGKTFEAKEEYKLLFAKWKRLRGLEHSDKNLTDRAIKSGRALLSVLRARGKASAKRCRELDFEIRELERQVTSAPPGRLAF